MDIRRIDESEYYTPQADIQADPNQTHFYLLRTTTTQEDAVVDMLYQKATSTPDSGVYSMLHPGPIKGYVFMEARDLGDAIQLVQGVPHTKGFVKGEVDFEKEVKPLLQPKSSVLDVKKGDLVELIAGPFKGEKAKVIRVDTNKEEVTVELIEATVPIPVTAKGMHIKLVDRVTQEKAEANQKKYTDGRGPVIGEGPLPPLRSEKKETKRLVLGLSEAVAPEPKKAEAKKSEEKKSEEAKDVPDEEIDEEKAAEEDANYFAPDEGDDEPDK